MYMKFFHWLTRHTFLFLSGSLFYEFNSFWFDEKPESIMEFNRVKDKFEEKVIRMLNTDVTSLMALKYKDNLSYMESLSSVSSVETRL